LHDWDVPDLLEGKEERPTADPARNVSSLMDSRFVRLDLDWDRADQLLSQVRAFGITPDRVFPSEYGLVRYAEDIALAVQGRAVALDTGRFYLDIQRSREKPLGD
jgi:hypothetical protein